MKPMEIWSILGLIVLGLIQYWIYKWRNPKCKGKLPPGSMGFPIIGETLQLIIPSHSLDVPPFLKTRLQRYGSVFRTHIAGRPAVISADPEINHLILRQDEGVLESWYFDLFGKIFKQAQRREDYGRIHKYIRNTALNHFGVKTLQTKLIVQLEQLVHKTLTTWSTLDSIEVKRAASKMSIDLGSKFLFGYDPEKSPFDLGDTFISFSQGLMSVPINIPGTAYHKCLQEHQRTSQLIGDVLDKKLESRGQKSDQIDLLDCLIADMDSKKFLTKDYMIQTIFSLLFASFDSLSSVIALSFKLLGENPSVLEEMIAEHEAILKSRENPDSPITWEEFKSMGFTLNVINETLRIGSVTPGLMRRAVKDFKVKDYTIPAGWTVIMVSTALHMNKDAYEDPLSFNPSRWNNLSAKTITDYFIPFGEGLKQCAGADYARVLIAIFFHVLLTKFRWEKIRGGQAGRYPTMKFKNGIHVKISPKTN